MLTDNRTHVVYLDRRVIRRMLNTVLDRQKVAVRAGRLNQGRNLNSTAAMLRATLSVKQDPCEISGPAPWIKRLCHDACDVGAALEVGNQLHRDPGDEI